MKKVFAVVTACIIGHCAVAQVPYFNWVRQTGEGSNGAHMIMDMDPNGNLLAAGVFKGSVDFDHSAGVLNFNAGSAKDIFISKTDPNGGFVWAKHIRGVYDLDEMYVNDIITDDQGNVYITGSYIDTVDFDPDPAVDYKVGEVHASNYDQDIFIAKYDADGEFIWVKTMGYHDTDYGSRLVLAGNGNLIAIGHFRYTVDFDPGPGITSLNSAGDYAVFILTLTPNGDFVDAKAIINTGVSVTARDGNGNLYLGGGFIGTVDFDPGAATYNLTASGAEFVCKLDSNLSCIWAKKIIAVQSMSINDMAVDANGEIFLVGGFYQGVDLDPSDSTAFDLVSAGHSDAYALKLDANGDFVWGKHFGGTELDEAQAVALDDDGNVYVGLNTWSTLDVDPGSATQTFTSVGGADLALLQLNNDGDFNWVAQISGTSFQNVHELIVTPSAVYSGGSFTGNTDFDPGTGVTSLSPDESWDYFIHKMSATPAGIEDQGNGVQPVLFPNPTSGLVDIATGGIPQQLTVEVYNSVGSLIETFITDKQLFNIDLSHHPVGMYMLKITNTDGIIATQKIVKQ